MMGVYKGLKSEDRIALCWIIDESRNMPLSLVFGTRC